MYIRLTIYPQAVLVGCQFNHKSIDIIILYPCLNHRYPWMRTFGILTAYILFGSQSLSFKLSLPHIHLSQPRSYPNLNRLKLKEQIYVPLKV